MPKGYAVKMVNDLAYCPHHDVNENIEMEKSLNSFELVCPECNYKIPALEATKGFKNAGRFRDVRKKWRSCSY